MLGILLGMSEFSSSLPFASRRSACRGVLHLVDIARAVSLSWTYTARHGVGSHQVGIVHEQHQKRTCHAGHTTLPTRKLYIARRNLAALLNRSNV
jgi:hypothetical protein